MAKAPRRALLLALATAGVAAAVAGYLAVRDRGGEQRPAAASSRDPFRGNDLPQGIRNAHAPSFDLPDARGGRVSSSELRGRPYVVTFLYTDCPDVCPLIGEELGRALRLLGPRADEVAAVAVSVDPKGDSRQAVRSWLRRHRLPANFHYAIGSRRQLKPVWNAYFVAAQEPGQKESRHSASIWLVDARGRWRTKFSAGVPVPPRDLAHDLRLLLRRRDRAPSTTAGPG